MHLLMLLPYLSKKNLMPRWRWNPRHPDVVRVTLLVVPAIWGLSIDQINAYVDTIFASFLPDGSVTLARKGETWKSSSQRAARRGS